jgi:hypothetical protein
MPKFSVCVAQTVRVYAGYEVEADSMAEAIEMVRKDAAGETDNWPSEHFEADDGSACEFSVVTISPGRFSYSDGAIMGIDLWSGPAGVEMKTAEQLRAEVEAMGVST